MNARMRLVSAVVAALAVGLAAGGCSKSEKRPPIFGAEKKLPPTTFNSDVAFFVYVVIDESKEPQSIGKTPSAKPVEIPPCLYWYVVPIGPVDMARVRQEIQAKKIPGLILPLDFTDADLAHLAGLTGLQTLELSGTQVTDEGIKELKKSLPNTTILSNVP